MSYFISITLNYTVCSAPLLSLLSCQSIHLFLFICPHLSCSLSFKMSPAFSIHLRLSTMQTCGSLPGMYCIHRLFLLFFFSFFSPPLCIYLCACRCSSSKQVSGQWGKKNTKEARLLREYLQSRQLANTALPSLVISSLCIVGRCSRLLTLHIPTNTLAGTSRRGFFLAKRHRTDRCKYAFSVHRNSIINIQNAKKNQKPVQSDDSPNTEDHCSECFPLQ